MIVYPTIRGKHVWKKHLRIYGGGVYILWGATETTFHSSEKILTLDARDTFGNPGKKSFSYFEERSQKTKTFVKGSVHPV